MSQVEVSLPLYEYTCPTAKCSVHKDETVVERLVKVKERGEQKCDECETLLERIPSVGTRGHYSWSSWAL